MASVTPAEAVAELDSLSDADPDSAHGEADRILLTVVPSDVRAAYIRLVQRCDWWATA